MEERDEKTTFAIYWLHDEGSWKNVGSTTQNEHEMCRFYYCTEEFTSDNHGIHSEEATLCYFMYVGTPPLHSDSILHAHSTSTVGPKSSLHERLETQGDAE